MVEDFRRDATEKLTFAEMRKRDEDNLRLVAKSGYEKAFDSLQEATVWSNHVMQDILLKFGINKNQICAQCLAMPLNHFLIQQFIKQYNQDPKTPKPMPVKPQALYAAKMLHKAQLNKDVQIEKRDNIYVKPEKQWKSGIYIYHHNEIAYFMSAPYSRKGGNYRSGHIIVPVVGRKWFILTNWKEGEVFHQVKK